MVIFILHIGRFMYGNFEIKFSDKFYSKISYYKNTHWKLQVEIFYSERTQLFIVILTNCLFIINCVTRKHLQTV